MNIGNKREEGTGDGQGHSQGQDQGPATWKIKNGIPIMPMPLAIICCILNFLIPGFGTMLAGLSMCSSRCGPRDIDFHKGHICLLGFGIGFLQLLATFLCFCGCIWSLVWGVFFIMTSHEYYNKNKVDPVDNVSVVTVQPQSNRTTSASTQRSGSSVVTIHQVGTRVGSGTASTRVGSGIAGSRVSSGIAGSQVSRGTAGSRFGSGIAGSRVPSTSPRK